MLCPAGTWSNLTGLGRIGACALCPPGSFGSTEGATSAASCQPCAPGSWSEVRGASEDLCGHCPAGRFSGQAVAVGWVGGVAGGRVGGGELRGVSERQVERRGRREEIGYGSARKGRRKHETEDENRWTLPRTARKTVEKSLEIFASAWFLVGLPATFGQVRTAARPVRRAQRVPSGRTRVPPRWVYALPACPEGLEGVVKGAVEQVERPRGPGLDRELHQAPLPKLERPRAQVSGGDLQQRLGRQRR